MWPLSMRGAGIHDELPEARVGPHLDIHRPKYAPSRQLGNYIMQEMY